MLKHVRLRTYADSVRPVRSDIEILFDEIFAYSAESGEKKELMRADLIRRVDSLLSLKEDILC